MAHMVNWFEIPALDLNRASTFYSRILGQELEHTEMMGINYAMFSTNGEGVSGAVAYGPGYQPNDQGTMVYLNAGDDLANALAHVEAAGGSILVPKTSLGEGGGFFAVIRDTEGNRVGLHSKN